MFIQMLTPVHNDTDSANDANNTNNADYNRVTGLAQLGSFNCAKSIFEFIYLFPHQTARLIQYNIIFFQDHFDTMLSVSSSTLYCTVHPYLLSGPLQPSELVYFNAFPFFKKHL